MKYSKTKEDDSRMDVDMSSNPIMRWLQHQEHFRFNIGDVLVKQTMHWDYSGHVEKGEWKTEMMSFRTKSPKKYLYVFENSLGIGYLRPLKADGSGPTGTLICTANLDPVNTRFILDSDYADHILLGGNKDEFTYNDDYAYKKKIREDAIAKNNEILVSDLRSKPKTLEWVNKLRPGDTFWFGLTWDKFVANKWEVIEVLVRPEKEANHEMRMKFDLKGDFHQVKIKLIDESGKVPQYARTLVVSAVDFYWGKVSFQQPFPLGDALSTSSE